MGSNRNLKPKNKKMKIFSLLVSVIAAENSLMVGTEQAECGGELCGTQHGRNKGSQVCMRVDQAAIDSMARPLVRLTRRDASVSMPSDGINHRAETGPLWPVKRQN